MATVTERVGLMTYVTCPIKRYHPAVVAQKAATVCLLSDGRFTLGLGAGENLNEHVTGAGWPPVNTRHAMLRKAVEIIRALFSGDYVNYSGRYFEVDSAKLWDRPATPPDIGIAVSGAQSCQLTAELADVMIAVEPEASLVRQFVEAGGRDKSKVGQIPVCFDRNRDAAVTRAHRLFRWFGGGWKVNSELPCTASFAAASAAVKPIDVADAIPCGSDVDQFVKAVRAFPDAGFSHIAPVQSGGDEQLEFIEWAAEELLSGAALLGLTRRSSGLAVRPW
ncbi:MAG TPA: TIGR03557 family F420-dependent LLM class oxidoreductase [Acidimicrobiales bacterium]